FDAVSRVLGVCALGALVYSIGRLVSAAGGIASFRDAASLVASSTLASALHPASLVVAPLFAIDVLAFVKTLPAAIGILALHHLWVASSSATFEDATVANAARRAARR